MLVEITGLYGNVLRLPTDGREGVSQWHSVSEQGATGMSGEQSVVVTGVSTGIGWGSCKVLLSKGFTVFGSVRRKVDADRLQSEFGDAFIPLIMDVTDKQAVELYLFYSASAFFAGLGFGRPDAAAMTTATSLQPTTAPLKMFSQKAACSSRCSPPFALAFDP
jgi:short chain dehydrogenase